MANFREQVGTGFDQFTRQAPVKALLALAKFAEPVNIAVLQFADESCPLFRQRAKLVRALWRAWPLKRPDMAERQQQIIWVVGDYMERTHEAMGEG